VNRRKRPEKKILVELYEVEKRTTQEIADVYHVGAKTISKWLILYAIVNRETDKQQRLANISAQQLHQWYWAEQKTVIEIAVIIDTSHRTILNMLERHHIPVRSNSAAQKLRAGTDTIKDSELCQLYAGGMSQSELGKQFGLTQTAIGNRLRKAGVKAMRSNGNSGAKNGMYGRKHSPEAMQKIRDANKRQFDNPANRERAALNTCKQIQEGRTGKAFNKLESLVAAKLTEQGVEFVQQFRLGRFLFDFYLPATNTLIEVHGTFWHADPRVYEGKALTPIQSRNLANDKRKEERAIKDAFNFQVMWEKDIHAGN